MPTDVLPHHLARLTRDELATVLTHRPEVLRGGAPLDLDEAAERLWHPYALSEAVVTLPLPALQLLETAQALGTGNQLALLARMLGADVGDVRRWAGELADRAVVVVENDTLHLPPALGVLIPDPLGLGDPAAQLLGGLTVDQLARMHRALRLPAARLKGELLERLTAFFGDPDQVRTAVAALPHELRTRLAEATRPRGRSPYDPPDEPFHDLERGYRFEYEGGRFGGDGPFAARLAAADALELAEVRGLAVPARWGWGATLPSEVVWALRGTDYHPPFEPEPPAPAAPRVPPPVVDVERGSAAAASTFAAAVLALVDRIVQDPPPLLKSGGLGTRELTKLTKALAVDEPTLRLGLELAAELGLLDTSGDALRTTPDWAPWRAGEPSRQLADLVGTWWQLGRTPSDALDVNGKAARAVAVEDDCPACRLARHALVTSVRELDATEASAAAARAVWRAPLSHPAHADDEQPLSTVWLEAHLLGVLADGVVTRLGLALLDGGDLEPIARDLLPATAPLAVFGSDLTAYVAGTPAAHVVAVLDSAAERESSGGAVTWRFSPATVRRAFDRGAGLDDLRADLESVAAGELPQPLRYLLSDVARRHGLLRLTATTTCVCSEDVALLAEVAAHRMLARFRPRLLAPTVLAADVAPATLLEALRKAGYFPVGDDEAPNDADAVVTLPARRRTPRSRRPVDPDPPTVAEALLSAGRTAPRGPAGITVRTLRRLSDLSGSELRLLAEAVDNRSRVEIVYEASSGSVTRRVIAEPELLGDTLRAWCELRSAERFFIVSRVRSVIGV